MMEADAAGRYLAFDLAGETYAIEVRRVEVVLEMVPITRVPRAAAHLRGVINYRGTVIPVADLMVRFGEGLTDIGSGGSIVVLSIRQGAETIGVLAESVREVIDLDPTRIVPAPNWGSKRMRGMIAGICERGGGFVIILNIDKAFAESDTMP